MKNYVMILAALAGAAACHKKDDDKTSTAALIARLDKIEQRLDVMDRRLAAAGGAAQRPHADPNTTYLVPLHADDVFRGAPASNAKVTIVEGFDFACPYCAMSRPVVEQVLAQHQSDVRVVSRQFVVHPQIATLPALSVCAARKQGKAAELESGVWANAWKTENNQPKFDQAQLTQDAIDKVAGGLQLDMNRFHADAQSPDCKTAVEQDQKELAAVGTTGTPAFFINGKPYQGPRSVEGFTAAIEAEIKKADEAAKQGTAIADYYASLMKNAKKSL
jgi:protein-disulfide isomerase